MKKILISLLATFFIYGCSSDGASYYQLNSYDSIVKEIDKTIASHVWIPTNLRNVEIIDDPYKGRHKMIYDIYYSKEKTSQKDVYKIGMHLVIFIDDVLVSNTIALGQLDCHNYRNSYMKILLQDFFMEGEESSALKVSISILNDGYLAKFKEYTPNREKEEVSLFAKNREFIPKISPEMYKIQNQFKNLICSNPIK